MEKIIYQTNGFQIAHGAFLAALHVLFIAVAVNDDTFSIKNDYPQVLGGLILIWALAITSFKKFTLTESEFIVEYSLLVFMAKPNRIPLNDIDKLVFEQRGQSTPFVEIYRTSKGELPRFAFFTSREPKQYYFMHNNDYIRKLMRILKANEVQVECYGSICKENLF